MIVVSMARIHRRNLIYFGIVPLLFAKPEGLARLHQGDALAIENVAGQLQQGPDVIALSWYS